MVSSPPTAANARKDDNIFSFENIKSFKKTSSTIKNGISNHLEMLENFAESIGQSSAALAALQHQNDNINPLISTKSLKHLDTIFNGGSSPMSSEDRKEFLRSMLMIGSDAERSIQKMETKKKKKKKKKKKASSDSSLQTKMLRPRNFLEAALYFSTITMSTLEMGLDLEPIDFFAPPILPFIDANSSGGKESSIAWLESLKKSYTPPPQASQLKPIMANGTEKIWNMKSQHPKAMLVYEQHKAIQQKTLSLFSLALLQNDTPKRLQPLLYNITNGDEPNSIKNSTNSAVSTKNNYFKRAIGHYAISLVDHLPPKLSDSIFRTQQSSLSSNTKDKALELNDLKIPSSHILSNHFFDVLSKDEKILILEEEISSLKDWVSTFNHWCTCTSCSAIPKKTLSVKGSLELFYRLYLDDLERALLTLTQTKKNTIIPQKKKEHLLKNLAISLSRIGDDIIDEKAPFAIATLTRIGKALEDDLNGPFGERKHSRDCNCHICLFKKSFGAMTEGNGGNGVGANDDDDDDSNSDKEGEEDESFYENMNFVEDESIIIDESDLPISPLHLTSTFPHLYDPSIYSVVSHPGIPSLSMIGLDGIESLGERIGDGMIIYQNLVDLLFQFALIPSFLEEEVKEKRRELLREEENEVRRKEEKAKAKSLAKQKAKERKKLASVSSTDAVVSTVVSSTDAVVSDVVVVSIDSVVSDDVIASIDSVVSYESISNESVISNDIVGGDDTINSNNAINSIISGINTSNTPINLIVNNPIETTIIDSLENLLLEDDEVQKRNLSGEAPESIITSSWFDRILGRADQSNQSPTEWIWSTPSLLSSGTNSVYRGQSQNELPPGIFSPSPTSGTPSPKGWNPFL